MPVKTGHRETGPSMICIIDRKFDLTFSTIRENDPPIESSVLSNSQKIPNVFCKPQVSGALDHDEPIRAGGTMVAVDEFIGAQHRQRTSLIVKRFIWGSTCRRLEGLVRQSKEVAIASALAIL